MADFFDGVEDVDGYEGRTPKLTVGNFRVRIKCTEMRTSKKHDKDYFQTDVVVLESNSAAHPVNSEACVQIWPAKFQIHQRKIKALVEAAQPGAQVTSAFCKQVVAENLLEDQELNIRVTTNAKGYPEEYFSPVTPVKA